MPPQAWHMRHAGAVAAVVGRGVGLRVVVVGLKFEYLFGVNIRAVREQRLYAFDLLRY